MNVPEIQILCTRCRRKVPSSQINPGNQGGCHLCMKPKDREHCPRHRYDCGWCKYSWNCGLACGCVLDKNEYAEPPEGVKLDRLHAFLNDGRRFIKDKVSLERYIESIWKDN